MSDPRPLYRQLTSGTVGSAPTATLLAARRALNEGADDLDRARSKLRQRWVGVGADGAAECFERRSAALVDAAAALEAAVELLATLAAEQDRVKRAATPLLQWWCRAHVLLLFTNRVLLDLISAQVCVALLQLRDTHRAELAAIAACFDGLATGTKQVTAPTISGNDGLPAAGTPPRAVADWWRDLTPDQQISLQSRHPDELAELDGLPPTVLDGVNRARVVRDRTRAQADVDAANAGLRAHGLVGMPDAELLSNRDPEVRRLGRAHAEAQDRLMHTDEVDAAVRSAQASAAQCPPIGPVLLLAYRNTGAGGLAIGFGDRAKSDDVAVNVPGTTSGPASPSLSDASRLRREMDRRDPAGTHAVVQWVDYDAPDSIVGRDVTKPDQAREGAPRLVGDVAGWRAAGDGKQHITVIGHSYGSTLVGFAGQHGLRADDIAVVGSPGVGASTADGLSAGRGHVWAGSAEHDPVVQVTDGDWYTTDGSGVGPYDKSFGARQFDATNPNPVSQAHSTYYDEGSPSLRNLAAISTGDYSAVSAADPDDTALGARGRLGNAWEGAEDVLRGESRSVTEILTGHPGAAVRTSAATGFELASDVVDTRLGGVGHSASGVPATVLKEVLDVFF